MSILTVVILVTLMAVVKVVTIVTVVKVVTVVTVVTVMTVVTTVVTKKICHNFFLFFCLILTKIKNQIATKLKILNCDQCSANSSLFVNNL